MPEHLYVVTIKAGQPTVEEARARLKKELDKARSRGAVAVKLIHGYGSSGAGGRLQTAIRASLHRRQKEGAIRCYVPGEKWSIFESTAREILDACPELARDQDLNGYNEGITIVLL